MPDLSPTEPLATDTVYLKLQDRIGYAFQDPSLLERALTHPSSTVEEDSDNERLEFLGDAVLNLCIARTLYERNPKWSEGRLTQVKSVVVSTQTLARVAEGLCLRKLGRLGKGLPADEPLPPSVNANLFEAVCGAVYLDGGIDAARTFILRLLDGEIRATTENGHEPNYKSSLQQFAQRALSLTPHYRVVSATGPDHGKVFQIVAVIGMRTFPPGVGRSKKEAEQAAAKEALEVLNLEGVGEASQERNAPASNGQSAAR
jgi:ribonuclease-3